MTPKHPIPIPSELPRVDFGTRPLAEYRTTLVPGMYEELVELGRALAGARVLHLSATAYGGGVAEIMHTLMPLMHDVGLRPEWGIIHGTDEFFDVTKLLHNSLQGDERTPTDEQWATWHRYQELNAGLFEPSDYDVVFVHDPQPAGIARLHSGADTTWGWRCHIDLSTPNPRTLAALLPELEPYGVGFFHRQEYVPAGYASGAAWVVPPAIDPLNVKNMALSRHDAAYIVRHFGVDPERPMIAQVSRFDPWKDPLGVVDAWRIARADHPGLQLVLVGSLAADDPEGQQYLDATIAHIGDDADAFVLTNLDGVGEVEVNAFQVAAGVVLQKSTREGFGLTVSEALWKGRPVIGGNVGGIRSQITDGVSGWLVDSVEQAGAAISAALADPAAAAAMAMAGKEQVRERFLTPRYLRDHLLAYRHLLGA
ncbi:MAG: glycosyl transferase group 1 [Thermoleophilia bacterium]|nr:glycosyl transferase group 1 [Thermoleophilia bacterium]